MYRQNIIGRDFTLRCLDGFNCRPSVRPEELHAVSDAALNCSAIQVVLLKISKSILGRATGSVESTAGKILNVCRCALVKLCVDVPS